jgi:RHS repeat-associated protein
MFELAFDYGTSTASAPDQVGSWARRVDPFSTYRAGFEVRTYRLCRRVLMFHRFPNDPAIGPRRLVRSLDLSYRTIPQASVAADPGYSMLRSATHWSYQQHAGTWHRRAIPPVEFTYSDVHIDDRVRAVTGDAIENLPTGLGGGYQWIDLDGEGLSGVLTEQSDTWYYKPNIGEGPDGPRFGPMRPVVSRPAIGQLNAGGQQLIDIQGNGALDLVNFHPPLAGFHERDEARGWKHFVPFSSVPNIDWDDANLRFIDLTGDGHADALITEDEVFTWYPSQGEAGFGAAERTAVALDEREGPRIVFADAEQAIFLADMSGDGLTDIVRIRNGQICYWPNLGYGRFGKQVPMDRAPSFDHVDVFDHRRIRLADIDGSGTADLIYLGRDGATAWFNRSGNAWSAPAHLPFPPATTNVSRIQVADLLGNGTACLVWSSDLPADSAQPLRYVDLMGGTKPHLMVEVKNNLGAITQLQYAASTRFYLRDKANATPWVTKLPFPVQCVERVTVIDTRRQTTFVNTYSYHHGYFDGVEREFSGFGRVEQVDTQRFDAFAGANSGSLFVASDQALYQPPVKTITWFHTGIAADRTRILGLYEEEYFPRRYADRLVAGGVAECELPQPRVDVTGPALNPDEWREAMRACKGTVLREEVIELDLAALHDRGEHVPVRLFSAGHHNCHIRRVQPRGPNQHAVFLVTESEALTYQYELAIGGTGPLKPDPRVAHVLNLRFDDYRHPVQSVSAVYSRLEQHADSALTPTQLALIRAVQNGEQHVAYTENRFTDELPMDVDSHRIPAVCERRTFDLTGIQPPAGRRYFTVDVLRDYQLNAALDTQATTTVKTLRYHEQPPDGTPHERIVEHVVTLYFKDDLSGPQALGLTGRLGLVYEAYKLALTDSLLDVVFAHQAPEDDCVAEAKAALATPAARNGFFASGYQIGAGIPGRTSAEPEWWIRSGLGGYEADAPQHFYLAERYIDPFGNQTRLTYDVDDLFVESSVDAIGNPRVVDAFDRRVLAPSRLTDANDNVSETAYDVRGLSIAAATMGKVTASGSETHDSVAGLGFDELNPDPNTVAQFFDTTPLDDAQARTWLGAATQRYVYDFGERSVQGSLAWGATVAGACSIVREKHERDAANAVVDLQLAFEYSDGAGQAFVKKLQAEPDPAIAAADDVRWITNGRTIVNNKNKPVLQYEPYFSATPRFEEPAAVGVSPVMFYDGPGRLIRTEHPDGTITRVEFSPWSSRSFDQNDTVLESRWYRDRGSPDRSTPLPRDIAGTITVSDDFRAAWLAAHHANTPAEVHFDSLGREVIAVAHNRSPDDTAVPLIYWSAADWGWKSERVLTFTKLDAEGKPLWICDGRGNLVMQFIVPAKAAHTPLSDTIAPDHTAAYVMPATAAACYDIAGSLLVQHSMDAGRRRMLMDAAGQPLFAWDYNERTEATTTTTRTFNEHRRLETRYDALRRPTERRLRIRDDATGAVQEALVERYRYGEGTPGDKTNNLRGQLWQHYDGSGLAQIDAADLTGKSLVVRRVLYRDADAPVVDWQGRELDDARLATAPIFDAEVFTQRTEYDALGRMTRHYNWHVEDPANPGNSVRVAVYLPQYNRRGVLEKEALLVRARKIPSGHAEDPGATQRQDAIKGITYDAKGQKLSLALGNGTLTRYEYDPDTFRLIHLFTRRDTQFPNDCGSGSIDAARPQRPCGVQNLHYTYDAAGNITHLQDDAQQTIYFANTAVEPSNDYVYDALYRLIESTGRENAAAIGAPGQPEGPWPAGMIPSPSGTRTYTLRYRYDAVGNLLQMQHIAPNLGGQSGNWTRYYGTAVDSNRLLHTWQGDPDWNSNNATDKTEYVYDVHGSALNLNAAPDRFDMRWDWNDMIHTIDLGGGGRASYRYGSDKERCRKRLVRDPALQGMIAEDRIYLGGYERYRRYTGGPNDPVEDIESHHLVESEQRVLLVDDVLAARSPRPDGLTVRSRTLWRYQYGNHLGSVSVELDDEAQIISHEEFHPYGTTAYRMLQSAAEAPPKRYRYSGMERDEESGLIYQHARYAAPWLARWLSGDPIGVTGGLNVYAYVDGNPAHLVDLVGERPARPDELQRLAVLRSLMDMEMARFERMATPFKVMWSVLPGGPTGRFNTAQAHYKAYTAAIDRAKEGEDVRGWNIDPFQTTMYHNEEGYAIAGLQNVPNYQTASEAYWERQLQVGAAGAASPISAVGYVVADVAGASEEAKEAIALTGAVVWDIALGASAMRSQYQSNQSLSGYDTGSDLASQEGYADVRVQSREYTRMEAPGGVSAQVKTRGALSLAIQRGEQSSGTVLFLEAMGTLGSQVKSIDANWGTGMPSNLDMFNQNLRAGMSVEDAARATYTGRWAGLFGFTKLEIDPKKLVGTPGNYTKVEITFKPGDGTEPVYLRLRPAPPAAAPPGQ